MAERAAAEAAVDGSSGDSESDEGDDWASGARMSAHEIEQVAC